MGRRFVNNIVNRRRETIRLSDRPSCSGVGWGEVGEFGSRDYDTGDVGGRSDLFCQEPVGVGMECVGTPPTTHDPWEGLTRWSMERFRVRVRWSANRSVSGLHGEGRKR